MSGWIDKIIDTAQKLGGLSAAAIFALISVGLGYIVYRKEKFAEESNEKWRITRDGQIRAEEAQTAVVSKLVDVTSMNATAVSALAGKVDVMVALIRDRKESND